MAGTLAEYVVALGANIDTKSINSVFTILKKGNLSALAMKGAVVALGTAMYKFVKQTTENEYAIEREAKKRGKSIETIRSEQNALTAMGKTKQEIAKDPSLKKIYDDLLKTNKAMALPDMKNARANVMGLYGSFVALKDTVTYAMQWVNANILEKLEAPILRIKGYFEEFRRKLQINMPVWSAKIGGFVASFAKGLFGIVELAGKLGKWIAGLPTAIKTVGSVALAVFAAIKAGPIGWLLMAVQLVGALIDDYDHYKKNLANGLADPTKGVALPSLWDIILKPDTTIKEKVKSIFQGLGELVQEALGEINLGQILSEDPALAGIGVVIVGSIFGMSAKAKIITLLVGALAQLVVDPNFRDNCKKIAEVLYQALEGVLLILSDILNEVLINLIPKGIRDALGIVTAAERRENNKSSGIDENGNYITTAKMVEMGMSEDEMAAARERGKDDARVKAFDALTESGVGFTSNSDGTISFDNLNDGDEDTQYQYNRAITDAIMKGSVEDVLAIAGRMKEHQDLGDDRGIGDWMVNRDGRMDDDQNDLAQWLKDFKTPKEETSSTTSPNIDKFAPATKSSPIEVNPLELDTSTFETASSSIESAADTQASAADDQSSAADSQKSAADKASSSADRTSSSTSRFSGDITRFTSAVGRFAAIRLKTNSLGGRYDQMTATTIAEDGSPEYIIPIGKAGRAFPLIKQMLGEMGGGAVKRIMSDLGLNEQGTIGSDLLAGASSSFGSSNVSIVNNYNNNVNVQNTIQVQGGGSAKETGYAAYNASERYLLRAIKGATA